jgi:anti-sigma-K factor RskA
MNTDLHSLAAAYALDALDADERTEFESHLASCATCAAELAEFGDVTAGLAGSDAVTPPAHLRASVLSQLDSVDQELPGSGGVTPAPAEQRDAPVVSLADRRRRKLSLPNLLAAAAVVALIAVGAVLITGNSGGTGYDDVASANDAVITQLAGESGTVDVAYSAELDRVALRGSGFEDLAPGLRYALWAIADGTPIPAGLFEPDDGSIEDVAELEDVTAQAWGITIEPDTGSDVPTTDIIYYAEV